MTHNYLSVTSEVCNALAVPLGKPALLGNINKEVL